MENLQTRYNVALEALALMRERAEQAEDARESAERDITEHCKENQRLRGELRRIMALVRTAHDGASVETRTMAMGQLGGILNDYRDALDEIV